MNLISKIIYQARIKGLEIEKNSDEVLLKNPINKKYIKILPNGEIFSDDNLGHDSALKELLPKFITNDPFSGSFICIPTGVTLRIGRETPDNEIVFAIDCVKQSFANIKKLEVVEDPNLLRRECMIDHKHDLSFKERQALIKACLEYLK